MSIIQNTFIGNEAGTGGALSLSTGRNTGGSASVWINESTFVGNKAEAYGGAIMLGSGFVHIYQSNFTSNNASQLGGALCLDSGGEVLINQSMFVGNTAINSFSDYKPGGAVVVKYGTLSAHHTDFIDNTGDDGGGVFVARGNVSVNNFNFFNKKAIGVGGAISSCMCNSPNNISITDSKFSHNTAVVQCAVLHLSGRSMKLISGSTFTYNRELLRYGDTYSYGDSGVACIKRVSISVLNSTFSHNAATLHSGVFSLQSQYDDLQVLFHQQFSGSDCHYGQWHIMLVWLS